jgi:hypothetical protein
MHKIDLGDEVKIEVSYKTEVYTLREPTVAELESFKSADEAGSVDALINLLEKLGMPKDVVMGMGMSKAQQLFEGLVAVITKKK